MDSETLKNINKPKYLCFYGITLSDLSIEEHKRNLKSSEDYNVYDKISNVFTSIEEWVSYCNLHCWNCDLNFVSKPVFYPKIIHSDGTIEREGVFCSFNCLLSWIEIYKKPFKDGSSLITSEININYLYKQFYGKEMEFVKRAPSKYIMKKYGGYVSESEYKKMLKES